MRIQIAMFLMNKKGYEVLQRFISSFGSEYIECVVSSKDPNVQEDYYADIEELCEINGIRFVNRKEEVVIESRYCLAIGWRWLISCDSKLIVLHDSLLPKYRGFAPLVSSLINHERTIGVTALFASAEYDKGDVIVQKTMDIEYPITIAQAIDMMSVLYWEVTEYITKQLTTGEDITGNKQNESEATYSLWRDEEDYKIDWSRRADDIRRFVDAVGFPYRGAYCFMDERKVRVLSCMVTEDVTIENRIAGKVIFTEGGFPIVVCGRGLIKLTEVVDDSTGESLLPMSKFRVRFR